MTVRHISDHPDNITPRTPIKRIVMIVYGLKLDLVVKYWSMSHSRKKKHVTFIVWLILYRKTPKTLNCIIFHYFVWKHIFKIVMEILLNWLINVNTFLVSDNAILYCTLSIVPCQTRCDRCMHGYIEHVVSLQWFMPRMQPQIKDGWCMNVAYSLLTRERVIHKQNVYSKIFGWLPG